MNWRALPWRASKREKVTSREARDTEANDALAPLPVAAHVSAGTDTPRDTDNACGLVASTRYMHWGFENALARRVGRGGGASIEGRNDLPHLKFRLA